MKNSSTIVTLSLVSTSILLATVATAMAQPSDGVTRTHTAPSNALEIAIGASYSQGTGDLGGGMQSVQDIAGAGGGVEGSIGWRATPNLMIGGYATLSGYGDPDIEDRGAVTGSTGFKADWHFLPTSSIDPWVGAGAGVKFMGIEAGEDDRALTGLEAKFQVGADFRVNKNFSIGPVIGASAATFTHEYDEDMSDEAQELDDKKVNWTFTAGLLGRFDTNGSSR